MKISDDIINETVVTLLQAVFEDGGSRAQADIDLGGKGEGWTLRLIVMPTEDESAKKPARDGTGYKGEGE